MTKELVATAWFSRVQWVIELQAIHKKSYYRRGGFRRHQKQSYHIFIPTELPIYTAILLLSHCYSVF